MGFHDVVFPPGVQYTTRIGPRHWTRVNTTDGGGENRVANREPTVLFSVVREGMTDVEVGELLDFIRARHGSRYAYRIADPTDESTELDHTTDPIGLSTPQLHNFGVGDSAETAFQLVKRYNIGTSFETARTITKPVPAKVRVYVDSIEKTEGVDWSINYVTGIVTFASPPLTALDISWAGMFDVVVRFSEEVDAWMGVSADEFDWSSAPLLGMVEVSDLLETLEHFDYGGAKNVGDIGGLQLSLAATDGRMITAAPTVSAGDLLLPDHSGTLPLRAGGPWFRIRNTGSQNVVVKTFDGLTTVKTIPAANSSQFWIGLDSGALKEWVVAS